MVLRIGELAPEFSGTDQNGILIQLRDFHTLKNVVLFFYPKDFSPGCTAEVCAFRDHFSSVAHLDAVVIGVSGDNELLHQKFSSTYALPYHLLSDTDGVIGKKYGVRFAAGFFRFNRRVSYVIDKEGVVRGVFRHEIMIRAHVRDVLACLEQLQSR